MGQLWNGLVASVAVKMVPSVPPSFVAWFTAGEERFQLIDPTAPVSNSIITRAAASHSVYSAARRAHGLVAVNVVRRGDDNGIQPGLGEKGPVVGEPLLGAPFPGGCFSGRGVYVADRRELRSLASRDGREMRNLGDAAASK